MLSSPYIFSLETPLLVFNGRLFQAREPTIRQDDFIDIRTARYCLEEISSPIEIERLQFAHEQVAVQEFKAGYAQQTLQRELLSRDFVEKQIAENKVLSFIVNKVLPVLTGSQLDQQVDSLLTGRTEQDSSISFLLDDNDQQDVNVDRSVVQERQRIKRELIAALEQEYKQYKAKEDRPPQCLGEALASLEGTRYARLRDGSIFNESLLTNYRILIIDDKVFTLLTAAEHLQNQKDHLSPSLRRRLLNISPTRDFAEIEELLKVNKDEIEKNYRSRIINKLRTTKIKIAEVFFAPFYVGKTSELIVPYQKLIERAIKEQALEDNDFQAQQLQAIAREKQSLENIVRRGVFERNNAGFEINNGDYYVFIKTPAYALKSPHNNNFYEFKSAKIAVSISRYGNGFQIGRVVIINDYKHPFLSGNGPMQPLCVGTYAYEYNERGMNAEQKILSRLSVGKQIVMSGYGTGANPYRKLIEENFAGQKISEAEVNRKKLPVLNISSQTRGVA